MAPRRAQILTNDSKQLVNHLPGIVIGCSVGGVALVAAGIVLCCVIYAAVSVTSSLYSI